MPIILGLPFLTANKIVCNYAACQCMATGQDPPYNLLMKTTKTVLPITSAGGPDILAALKERITMLSFKEELAA